MRKEKEDNMKLIVFVLLVQLVTSLIEKKKTKKRKADTNLTDRRETTHPAAFSLR